MVSECWGDGPELTSGSGLVSRFNQSEPVLLLEEVVLLSLCPRPSFVSIQSHLSYTGASETGGSKTCG